MATYTYAPTPAIDPVTGNVPYGSTGQLYAPTDTSHTTPISVTDVTSGLSITSLVVSNLGYVQGFIDDVYPTLIWWDGTYAIVLDATGGRVPDGGTDGQVLTKVGSVDGATEWADAASGSVAPGDIDSIVEDLVLSGTGATVAALDGRYKQLGTVPIADLPGGSVLFVLKSGSTWPARPTARTDIMVFWCGADPAPSIVTSGTGGALSGVDKGMVPQ